MKNRQKIFVTLGVFVALLLAAGILNFLKFKERRTLLAELDRLAQEEKAAQEKIRLIPELLDKRAELVATIDRYAEILPNEDDVTHLAFVNTIDKYRQDTKILIQRAEYVPIKEDEKTRANRRFLRHRYRFQLLGTFPDFVEFVNKIENHTRFLKVDAFTIRPLGSRGGAGEDINPREDGAELNRASNPVKEIELTVSTYTYSKGA